MTLIGTQHNDLVRWLENAWWQNSVSPACILQGFPGAGKTEIADVLQGRLESPGRKVTVIRCQCAGQGMDSLEYLIQSIATELAIRGDDRLANLPSANTLLMLLRSERLLVVVDEFQESFKIGEPEPDDALAQWVEQISSRRDLHGRVLFLTSREVGNKRWCERCEKRKLRGLSASDSVVFIDQQLRAYEVPDEDLPHASRQDVAKWLGGFPRALRLLVSSLNNYTLEELIGVVPQAWETRNQPVSPTLLKSIETEMVARARKGLPAEIDRFLERLAVFRLPVDKHAILAVGGDVPDLDQQRDELLRRFLLEHRHGLYTLHPVLREAVLMPLTPTARSRNHAMAARHYSRHFNAKEIVGMTSKLGRAFMEARYHLTQSNNNDELKNITFRFEAYVRSEMDWHTPVPENAEELNERIALLSALLHEEGSKSLHYYLARLLEARRLHGDFQRALPHAVWGTGPRSPQMAWSLRLRVITRCNGSLAAVADARENALKILAPEKNLFSLYLEVADLLTGSGKSDDAVALLKEGIGRIGPQFGLFALYQSAAALLGQSAKADEAIALLKQGIGLIGPEFNLFSLYEIAASLLAQSGKADDAVALLKEGIGRIGPQFGLFSLYQSAAALLGQSGKADEAIALLKEGIGLIGPEFNLFSLYEIAAALLAQSGRADDAVALLQEGIGRIGPQFCQFSLYQSAAEFLGQSGKADEAIALLREGISRIGSQFSQFSLYQSAAKLLGQSGKVDEAVALLREGIGRIEPQFNLFSLYQSTAEFLGHGGQVVEAIALLKVGIRQIGAKYNGHQLARMASRLVFYQNDPAAISELHTLLGEIAGLELETDIVGMYAEMMRGDDAAVANAAQRLLAKSTKTVYTIMQVAYAYLYIGRAGDAQVALNGVGSYLVRENLTWLVSFVEMTQGNQVRADELLAIYLGRPLIPGEKADRTTLLGLWDTPAERVESWSPANHFPVISPKMTGLFASVRRTIWEARVLTGRQPAPLQISDAEPWNAQNIVIGTRPEGWSGLYVIGCFDRRITFFTQQARALTLVRALFEVGDLKAGQSVAIVGAGAAGVTAAVAAAKSGCNVTLYDDHDAILALQAPAQHRYLHPHIYDWPEPDSTNPNAGLPFLDWSAGNANDVVARLRDEFSVHLKELGGRLEFKARSSVSYIEQKHDEHRLVLLGNNAMFRKSFHVVLLASGFGLEASEFHGAQTSSYWSGDALDGPFSSKKKILVSGAGDGGLVDVARAALRSRVDQSFFRHHEAVDTLATDPEFSRLAQAMSKIDSEARQAALLKRERVDLFGRYDELEIPPSLLERLRQLKRHDTAVTFNFIDTSVFSLNAALLNRLLVFLLLKGEVVSPVMGKIVSISQSPANPGQKRVNFTVPGNENMDFDLVIIRHGPSKNHFVSRFPALEDACRELGGKVAELALTQRLSADTVRWFQRPS